MFRSRNTRKSGRSALRRPLGVELMEGRLMLSTTTFDLPQRELDVPHFAFSQGKASLTGVEINVVAQAGEGGFITATLSDGTILSANLANVRGTVSGTVSRLDSADVSQLFFNSSAFNSNAFNSNGIRDWLNDSSQFADSGLQPAKINPTTEDSDLSTNMSPVVVGPPGNSGRPSEGGSIPIHTILADLQRGSGLAVNSKSATALATEKVLSATAAERRISVSEDAMAGEWARGTMFEIAGGEPDASDASSLRRRDKHPGDSLDDAQPLSSADLQSWDKISARENTADKTANGPRLNESSQLEAAIETAHVAAVTLPATMLPFMADGGLSLAYTILETVGRPSTDNLASQESKETTAATAVFDQLGEGNSAVIESSIDGKTWLRSIGASPLLMVLALERIAALNSRRAPRDSRAKATNKPRRS